MTTPTNFRVKNGLNVSNGYFIANTTVIKIANTLTIGSATVNSTFYTATANAAIYANASSLTGGPVKPAQLGSGIADATTILYGDGTWKQFGGYGQFLPLIGGVMNGTVTLNINSGSWSTTGITSGVVINQIASTIVDTPSSNTVSTVYLNAFKAQTLSSNTSNTVTVGYAVGAYFAEPVAGTKVTITSKAALVAESLAVTFAGTAASTTAFDIGSSQTSQQVRIGSGGGTGQMVFGRSNASQLISISDGATLSSNTKTITIGTGGLSGSTTRITAGTFLSNTFVTLYANTINLTNNTAITVTVGNSSVFTTVNSTAFSGSINVKPGSTIMDSSGSTGASGQVLTSNATGVYWSSRVTALEQTGVFTSTNTSITLTKAQKNSIIQCSNTAAITIYVPNYTDEAFDIGNFVELYQINSGRMTVLGSAGVTLQSKNNLNTTNTIYSTAVLRKVDTNTWRLSGDLV